MTNAQGIVLARILGKIIGILILKGIFFGNEGEKYLAEIDELIVELEQ